MFIADNNSKNMSHSFYVRMLCVITLYCTHNNLAIHKLDLVDLDRLTRLTFITAFERTKLFNLKIYEMP